jgi:TolB-like protein/DNA-binding SARP family transcriptional activator
MIRFRTLSTVQLTGTRGERLLSVTAQPKRLALLAYLSVANGGAPHRRDTLLTLLWPELSSNRARAALRKALHYLREGLGQGVILCNGDEEVAVSESALECDARKFQEAVKRGALADAVEIYTGEFLPGVHVPSAPEFERWLDGERLRLCEAALASAMSLAQREAGSGRFEAALPWAERAVALAPLDERVVRYLIDLHLRAGDNIGAMRTYNRYARALSEDLELEPAEDMQRLMEGVPRRITSAQERTVMSPEAAPTVHGPGHEPEPTAQDPRTPPALGGGDHRASRRWLSLGPRLAVVALFIVAAGVSASLIASDSRARSVSSTVRSVAVLPLVNLNRDSSQEYFAEGLTEALGAELARTRALQVVSGVSAARYRNTTRTVRQIARELGVDALLDGTFMRSGDRVRVTVRLVDGRTDRRLWSHTYDRYVGDIFALYGDIASGIATEVSARADTSSADTARAAAPKRTANRDAYDAFLRGEYFRKRWMNGGCVQAEHYFQQAIVLDSSYAPAYAGLATCYAHPDRLRRPVTEVLPKARAAALRALELDQNIATAHTYLGYVYHRLEYDAKAAGREHQLAVALNPNDPDARRILGEFLYITGRPDEGLAEMRRSLELDPFHLDNSVSVGFGLRNLKRYDEAIALLARTLELEPHYAAARLWLAESYASRGNHDLAVIEYAAWLREVIVPARASIADSLKSVYARSGWNAFWQAELKLCEEERSRPRNMMSAPFERHCGPYFMARRYARLGDSDRAIASLASALEQRHHLMVFIEFEPLFDKLHADARFRQIVQRVQTPVRQVFTTGG